MVLADPAELNHNTPAPESIVLLVQGVLFVLSVVRLPFSIICT